MKPNWFRRNLHAALQVLPVTVLTVACKTCKTNPSTTLVKAPMLLWMDSGLAIWLAGIKSSADVTTRMDAGFWLEQTQFQTLETWRASIHDSASRTSGATARGTKWTSFWKRPASWSPWKSRQAIR